jgi:hypothetical protein
MASIRIEARRKVDFIRGSPGRDSRQRFVSS